MNTKKFISNMRNLSNSSIDNKINVKYGPLKGLIGLTRLHGGNLFKAGPERHDPHSKPGSQFPLKKTKHNCPCCWVLRRKKNYKNKGKIIHI